MKYPPIKVGDEFTRWTTLRRTEVGSGEKWLCRCVCGTEREVLSRSLKTNHSRSCGCLHSEIVAEHSRVHNRRHGETHTPEYAAYMQIKQRMYNKNATSYSRYETLQIQMCQGWLDSVESFIKDAGRRPSPELSIDRKNNLGGYWCGHCEECLTNGWTFNIRWATAQEQARNTRRNRMLTINGVTKCAAEWAEEAGLNSMGIIIRLRRGESVDENLIRPPAPLRHFITYQGVTQHLAEWARQIGIGYKLLHQRIQRDGWSFEKAITTPVR